MTGTHFISGASRRTRILSRADYGTNDKSLANTSLNMPIEPVYTVKECADKLKVTERTILELIRKKKLRAVKVGREYRITETAINGFIGGTPPTGEISTKPRKKRPS